jgi:hypothetical protein
MPITKQRTLDYMQYEWGTYMERFQRLSKEEQAKRVREMGYDAGAHLGVVAGGYGHHPGH